MAESNPDAEFSRRIGEFTLLESIVSNQVIAAKFAGFPNADLQRRLSNVEFLKTMARECIVKAYEGNVTGENVDILNELKSRYGIPSQLPHQQITSYETWINEKFI